MEKFAVLKLKEISGFYFYGKKNAAKTIFKMKSKRRRRSVLQECCANSHIPRKTDFLTGLQVRKMPAKINSARRKWPESLSVKFGAYAAVNKLLSCFTSKRAKLSLSIPTSSLTSAIAGISSIMPAKATASFSAKASSARDLTFSERAD